MDGLDATVEEGAEAVLDHEIAHRIAELDAGRAKTIPWEQIQDTISAQLRDGRSGI